MKGSSRTVAGAHGLPFWVVLWAAAIVCELLGPARLTDRVEALDGRLAITSPPDEGTTVTAEFPFAQ